MVLQLATLDVMSGIIWYGKELQSPKHTAMLHHIIGLSKINPSRQ